MNTIPSSKKIADPVNGFGVLVGGLIFLMYIGVIWFINPDGKKYSDNVNYSQLSGTLNEQKIIILENEIKTLHKQLDMLSSGNTLNKK